MVLPRLAESTKIYDVIEVVNKKKPFLRSRVVADQPSGR